MAHHTYGVETFKLRKLPSKFQQLFVIFHEMYLAEETFKPRKLPSKFQ